MFAGIDTRWTILKFVAAVLNLQFLLLLWLSTSLMGLRWRIIGREDHLDTYFWSR